MRIFLRKCEPCARYHRGKPPKQTRLKPFVAGEPFELVSIDVTGPHPTSRKGNRYMLTVMDSFSKWAEAYPIRNHHADTIARQLVNHFPRFGVPRQLLSDRGPEFESLLFAELCRLLKMDKIRTTSFKASTNGSVERLHSTLNSMLAKIIDDDQRNWDGCVPLVLAAYRESRHEGTGMSPNFIVFGRETRAPADLILPDPNDPTNSTGNTVEPYVENVRETMKRAYQTVREHLAVAAQRRKESYDTKVNDHAFEVGEKVWYFYPRRKEGRSPKWAKYYVGQYQVTRVIPPCNYVLQLNPRSRPFVVHGDKLKNVMKKHPRRESMNHNAPSDATPVGRKFLGMQHIAAGLTQVSWPQLHQTMTRRITQHRLPQSVEAQDRDGPAEHSVLPHRIEYRTHAVCTYFRSCSCFLCVIVLPNS